MAFNLSQAQSLLQAELLGTGDPLIKSLAVDTRAISKGALFIAYAGNAVDSHQYIAEAIQKGAVAVVVSKKEFVPSGIPALLVEDSRRALSFLADFFYESPSEKLLCIGVTGTNGKSTTHFLLHHALQALGSKGARLGTIGFEMTGRPQIESELTTPGSLELQSLIAQVRDEGQRHLCMEVASHGLHQFRVEDVAFDIGIFTNLTPDHLDYHKDVEEYFLAKRRLFDLVKRTDVRKLDGTLKKEFPSFAVLNVDCPYGKRMADYCHEQGLSYFCYGFGERADLQILRLEQTIAGSRISFRFQDAQFTAESPLIGRFNAENLAAVVVCLLGLGYASKDIAEVIPKLPPVPGRLEPVGSEKFGIYVDYAHTPDALEKALQAIRELAPKKLWVVFGCGGDRDPGRRFGMGAAAKQFADKVVVTSDNPRTEEPLKIINDILTTAGEVAILEPDRRLAIHKTLSAAEPGDIVLIAGKGHENYQIIGKERVHFSDQEEVEKWKAIQG